jgi:integrase
VNKAEEKFATAHDLRRAFGTRWAARVKPADLQKLMRHENIDTTMKYYVDEDAKEMRARLRKAYLGDPAGDPGERQDTTTYEGSADVGRKW